MSIKIGGAILGLPIIIGLIFGFCYLVSEAWFAVVAGNAVTDTYPPKFDMVGDCAVDSIINTTKMYCKDDFGLLGWKQWTSDKEEQLMEQTMFKIVNPEPQKIIIVPEDFKGTLDLKP